jgi:hypothetical protein
MWEAAWWASGAEAMGDQPFLGRTALKDKLTTDGNAERTVRNMINPSYQDKLIGSLIAAGMIEATTSGWLMIDKLQASVMMMRKSGCG